MPPFRNKLEQFLIKSELSSFDKYGIQNPEMMASNFNFKEPICLQSITAKSAVGLFALASSIILGATSIAKILKSGLLANKYFVIFPGPQPISKMAGSGFSINSQKRS